MISVSSIVEWLVAMVLVERGGFRVSNFDFDLECHEFSSVLSRCTRMIQRAAVRNDVDRNI